jgi:uncharacterized membrane protein
MSNKLEELENLELKIAKLLRYGVIFAGILIFVGWMLQIQFTSNPFVGFHDYHGLSLLESFDTAFATQNWAQLISYAGLFVLISLPILRVLMTAILFVRQNDPIMASLAFFVFVTILVSCALGLEL